MRTNRIFSSICVLLITCATSCKKYEDGPALSLRTKKSRFANEWKYQQIIAPNGSNITASGANVTFEFTKDGNAIITQGTSSVTGTWQFASDKDNVVVTTGSSGNAFTMHITRLKEKELWYTIENNGTYQYRMIPK